MKTTQELWATLAQVRKEAIELLRETVVYHKPFIDEESEDYTCDDWYELPCVIYTDKHGYNYNYYIYKVIEENGEMYFVGKDNDESGDEYNFDLSDLSASDILQVIDQFHTQNV